MATQEVNERTDLACLAKTVKTKVNGLIGVYSLLILGTIILFLLVSGIVVALELAMFNSGTVYPRAIVLGVIVILVAGYCLVIVLKPFFKIFERPEARGKEVFRKDYPELFSLIDEVVKKADCLQPKHVRISNECNAYVYYPSLLGYVFTGRQNLTIGLPLLYGLNKTELKAVLAHEFGHFTQKSVSMNRVANLSEFICASIARAQDEIDQEEDESIKKYAKGFARIAGKIMTKQYHKVAPYNAILSRAQEFDADHYSQMIAGTEGSVSALCKIEDISARWAHFTGIIASYEKDSERAPENVLNAFTTYSSHVDRLSGRAINASLHYSKPEEQFGSRLGPEENVDTHPSTAERVDAILSYPVIPTNWDDSPAYDYFSPEEVNSTFEFTTEEIKKRIYPYSTVFLKKNLTSSDIDTALCDASPYYLDKFCTYKLFFYPETKVDSEEDHPEYIENPFTKENAKILEEFYYAEDDMGTLESIIEENSAQRRYRYAGKVYDGKNVPIDEHREYFAPLKDKAYKIARHCNWWLYRKESELGKQDVLHMFRTATSVQLSLAAFRDTMETVNKIRYYQDTSTKAKEYVSSADEDFRNIVSPLMVAAGDKSLFDLMADSIGIKQEDSLAFMEYMSRIKTDLSTFVIAYSAAGNTTYGIQGKLWEEIKKDAYLGVIDDVAPISPKDTQQEQHTSIGVEDVNSISKSLSDAIASAWRSLDAGLLAPYLSDDFTYNSVWVSGTIVGKDSYLEYLRGKFETIRKSSTAPVADVIEENGLPKPHLVQQDHGVESILDFEHKDGFITRMLMRPLIKATLIDRENWYQYDKAYNENLTSAMQIAGKAIRDFVTAKEIDYPSFAWLQTSPVHPSFQHLCFRHQSDVYSILVAIHGFQSSDGKDDNGIVLCQQDYDNLLTEAEKNNLIPCIAPVALGARLPMIGGPNLVNAISGVPIKLSEGIKQNQVPMSAWEISNMGVQTVINHLREKNCKINSYCDLVRIEPQIWFEENGKTCYVIVRSIPIGKQSERFRINKRLIERFADYEGYFADVQFASSSPILKDENGEIVPLSKRDTHGDVWMWRGDGFYCNFTGLQTVEDALSNNSFIEVFEDEVYDIK